MTKKCFIFSAFVVLTFVFGMVKAEQGDFTTLGYNTPGGYSYWRVDSAGILKPGYASTYDLGTSALPIKNIYAGGLIGAAITSVSTSGVSVSTSATSQNSVRLRGAVVTLSTHAFSEGDIYYQTSDYKLYVATRTVAENVDTCAGTVCYVALN